MAIVSNSGPILSFGRAGLLDLLENVVKKIQIPDGVYDEIVVQGSARPAAGEVGKATWIQRKSVLDRHVLSQLSRRLHVGEQEAIALAQELNLPLLIDDKVARQEATRLGILHVGSIRILQTAKEKGLIKGVKPFLNQMIAAGMYVDERLYEDFLKRNSET